MIKVLGIYAVLDVVFKHLASMIVVKLQTTNEKVNRVSGNSSSVPRLLGSLPHKQEEKGLKVCFAIFHESAYEIFA